MPTPLPQQLKRFDSERLSLYKANLSFYQGDQWPRSRRTQRQRRQLTFNYARTVVNKITAYVMQGRSINVAPASDDEAAIAAAAAAEQAIATVHADNHADRLDYDTEVDTAVMGDGAFKVTWDTERAQVRITAPDVQGIYVWPLPHDLTTFQRVCHRYQLPGNDPFVAAYARAPDKPVNVIEDWTEALFDLWIEETPVSSVANPYGFIPYVIFPNESQPKKWFGISDIEYIRVPCEQLNRTVTRVDSILELSGNPITVLEGITQSEDIAAEPGAVWEIPAGAKAYLLDLLKGGGLKLHMDYVELLRDMLEDLAETPRTAFGETERDLSGIALQIQLQPLLQKVERKRLIRTAAYIRRTEMALQLLAQFAKQDHTSAGQLVVNWEAPTPNDRSVAIANEVLLTTNALASRRAAIARLGDVADVDKELQMIAQDAPAVAQGGGGDNGRRAAPA